MNSSGRGTDAIRAFQVAHWPLSSDPVSAQSRDQSQQLTEQPPRAVTRDDFDELRVWVQGVPVTAIARLKWDINTGTAAHAKTPEFLKHHLRAMRDGFVRLTLLNGSPGL